MSMSLYASKEEYEQAHAARWYCLDRDHGPEVHELFARLIERAHGIGA